MKQKLLSLTFFAMTFAVTSCTNAVVRHFSFERTHYVLKEGVSEAELQGAPWIDANIPGMVDNVEKPSLKDDFYSSVNYEMFVDGIPGPFDLSYEITYEKLNSIMNGGDYPNKDLFNQTRNLLTNGATAELKNYFDNFNVTKYISTKDIFTGSCSVIRLIKEPGQYRIEFNDGYSNELYGYQTLSYLGYYSYWYPEYSGYNTLAKNIASTIYSSIGYGSSTAQQWANTGNSALQDIIFHSDERANTITVVDDVDVLEFKSALLDAGLKASDKVYISPVDYGAISYLYDALKGDNANDYTLALKNIAAFERRHLVGVNSYKSISRMVASAYVFMDEVDISRYDASTARNHMATVMMPFIYEKAYIHLAGSQRTKDIITNLIEDILEAYKEMIADNSWLTDETKEIIIRKLDHMGYTSCYSDKIKNFPTLDETNLYTMNLLDIYDSYQTAIVNAAVEGTLETNTTLLAGMHSYTVNAFYSPTTNEFVILNGILPGGFIAENDEDIEVTYARAGMVIGHEISHAFDSTGWLFNEYGEYRRTGWWDTKDKKAFNKKVKKLRKFYDQINVHDDEYVSGTRVDGEATADMGAIDVMLALASKIEDFDYDLFFRSYAQLWKEEYYSLESIDEDSHPYAYLRVNVTLAQFDKFNQTYGIKYGDGMYVPKNDRVKIW